MKFFLFSPITSVMMSGPDEPPHLNDVYELDATAAWVTAGGHTRVALQMPDDLLKDCVAVAAALERRCNVDGGGGGNGTDADGGGGGAGVDGGGGGDGAGVGAGAASKAKAVKVFVLADTTFGSCCVDEVAAAHHDADCIVHFGRACMSPVSRLPARFVFNKVHVDPPACAAAIHRHAASLSAANATPSGEEYRVDALVVLVDQEHAHKTEALRECVLLRVGTVKVVVADPLPVEALPRERAHAAQQGGGGGGCCGGSTSCGGGSGGGGGSGCGGGGGCGDATCGACVVTQSAPAAVGGGGGGGGEGGRTGDLPETRRRVVERVTDNLAALKFHSGGGGGGGGGDGNNDDDKVVDEAENQGRAGREDFAAAAMRVEAAAAAADPTLGAVYASRVAEGMQAALSGSASPSAPASAAAAAAAAAEGAGERVAG